MKRKLKQFVASNEDVVSETESDSDGELSDDYEGGASNQEEHGKLMVPEDEAKIPTGEPPQKIKKLSKAELYKPPTNNELNELKERENLFHSSLFRMQITELLGEVIIKEKRKKQVDDYLHKLKGILENLPKQKEHEITQQKWATKKNVQVPFAQKPFQVHGKFRFLPPSSVKVIGSYMLGACIRPDTHVDLAVQISPECFQAKDYLNQRYLRKRALYLTKLAILLEGQEEVEDLSFSHHHGNHMKPILIITPQGKLGHHIRIHIHTWVQTDVLKLRRFHIKKNNIRPAWFNGNDKPEDDFSDASLDPPTPHYNTAVLQDLVLLRQLEVAHDALADADGVKDGIALLKVWLHQREVNKGYGCFSSFIMTMYVVYLMNQRKLNKMMSSYQVVRNTLINLSIADWASSGITMASGTVDQYAPTLEEFHDAFDVVFIDPSGYVNLCGAMTRCTLERVKYDAKLSLQFLETPGLDGFEALFMKPISFLRNFDQSIHIQDLAEFTSDELCSGSKVMDHCGSRMAVIVPALCNLLHKAIGRRVRLIAPKFQLPKEWSVNDSPPDPDDCGTTSFGFLLDPETSISAVDKGPPADSPKAKEFRDFWGEKSELRRFQDGSICEAAVWKCNSAASRRSILLKVLKYILKKHAGISWEKVKFVAGQLDQLLTVPSLRCTKIHYDTGEEQHLEIIQAYDSLAKLLRSLRDLPLAIHTIQGTSAAFRGADTFPPLVATCPTTGKLVEKCIVPQPDKACPQYVETLAVQCVLETSGKWPEDAAAVQRLRAAFHIQLADMLSNKHFLPTAAYPDHILVLKDGFVFRVQIGYLREITLLKMVKTSEGMVKMVETDEASALERQFVALPKFSSALYGIQKEHGSYSSAVRLGKRWISSQLMAHYIPEEAIELLMAQVYLQHAPFSVPGSPLVAFLRWLQLLANHDWEASPVIVNLNSEFTKKDYGVIASHFNRNRKTLPLMFIATPYDRFQSLWTKKKPIAQILQRLILLSRESLNTLDAQLMSSEIKLDYKLVFRPPLDEYDVLIHLDPKHLPRRHMAVDVSKENAAFKVVPLADARDNSKRHLPVVNYDPVQRYLTELREAFDEIALFFHDPHGGSYIAVLWKIPALQPQHFKVSHVNARQVGMFTSEEDIQLVPNIQAIMEDFKVIGCNLVLKVDKRK